MVKTCRLRKKTRTCAKFRSAQQASGVAFREPAEHFEVAPHQTRGLQPSRGVARLRVRRENHAHHGRDRFRFHRNERGSLQLIIAEEINAGAEILDVPVGTVKSRLSNAFRRLRDLLGGYVLAPSGELAGEAVGEGML